MKKFGFILLSVALLGATSCTEEIIVSNETVSSDPIELTFTASSDEFDGQVNTRTLVREGGNVFWVANDRISLFANGTNNPFITKDGGIVSDFRGTVAEQAGTYYALYPYNSDATIDGTVVSTVLYHEQYAEPDSYASGMSLSVSLSSQDDAQDLGFKHSASFLCVHISQDYQGDAIKFMELQGNNGEMLAGNVTINISPSDAAARIVEGEGQPVISLKQINADGVMIPGKSYYFVLAPQVLSQGYTLTLHNATGGICLITENESVTFERNYINHITITDANFKQSEACDVREDGYHVKSISCLREWATLVAAGETDLDCYIEADLDFNDDGSDESWPIIENYIGTISGGGFTIRNFTIDDNRQYAGLVGSLGVGGSIQNLTMDSPIIKSSYMGNPGSTSDDGFVGVFVGKLNREGMNNYTKGSITNCHVINPTIEGGENLGGIVGRSYGREDAITNCTVSGGTIQGSMFVGGIAGNSEGIIENCHVKNGTQISYIPSQAEARVGGIVGTNNSGQVVACTANTIVNGEVDVLDARYCGGIAGANNGTIIGCASSGEVVGAFGGAIAGESYGDIYGSYANETEAAALIYKIKKNMNDPADVTLPTFKACYWKTSSGNPIIGSSEESGQVDCDAVGDLSKKLDSMNNILDVLRNNNDDYAYGAYYQYERNTGDDKESIPYKATKPQ